MSTCAACKIMIPIGDGRLLKAQLLCEDCYIDAIALKTTKSHHNNHAEFMNRLKDACPARKQQFH